MNGFGFYDIGDLLNRYIPKYDSPKEKWQIHQRPEPSAPQPATSLEEEIARRKARMEEDQRAIEAAEKELEKQKNKIRYVADKEKIEMLIPREKIVKMISNLTKAINDNPDAKTYKLTINL